MAPDDNTLPKPEAVQSISSQIKKVEVSKNSITLKDCYLQAKSLMNVLNDESSRLRSQIAVLMETLDEQYGDLVDQI